MKHSCLKCYKLNKLTGMLSTVVLEDSIEYVIPLHHYGRNQEFTKNDTERNIQTMIPNINTVEQFTPTSLEIAFIETLIFYTCLDSFNEAIDSRGNIFQKTKEGSKFIHDLNNVLWTIADRDEYFDQRVDEYADLLKRANSSQNEPLTVLLNQRVNNFRTVNRHATGGDKHQSRLYSPPSL